MNPISAASSLVGELDQFTHLSVPREPLTQAEQQMLSDLMAKGYRISDQERVSLRAPQSNASCPRLIPTSSENEVTDPSFYSRYEYLRNVAAKVLIYTGKQEVLEPPSSIGMKRAASPSLVGRVSRQRTDSPKPQKVEQPDLYQEYVDSFIKKSSPEFKSRLNKPRSLNILCRMVGENYFIQEELIYNSKGQFWPSVIPFDLEFNQPKAEHPVDYLEKINQGLDHPVVDEQLMESAPKEANSHFQLDDVSKFFYYAQLPNDVITDGVIQQRLQSLFTKGCVLNNVDVMQGKDGQSWFLLEHPHKPEILDYGVVQGRSLIKISFYSYLDAIERLLETREKGVAILPEMVGSPSPIPLDAVSEHTDIEDENLNSFFLLSSEKVQEKRFLLTSMLKRLFESGYRLGGQQITGRDPDECWPALDGPVSATEYDTVSNYLSSLCDQLDGRRQFPQNHEQFFSMEEL